MVQKLLLFLPKGTKWRLLYKSLGAMLALGAAYLFRFSFLGCLVYGVILIVLSRSEFSNRRTFLVSYWTLGIVALVGLHAVMSLPPLFAVVVMRYLIFLGFGALFSVLLGIINLLFSERFLWYRLFHSVILFFVFVALLYLAPPLDRDTFFPLFFWSAGVFVIITLLMREVLSFLEIVPTRSLRLASAATGLVAVQVATLGRFLPLGFVSGGAFLAVVLILLRDTLIAHYKGILSFSFVLKELTFFVVFTSILFVTTPWFIR